MYSEFERRRIELYFSSVGVKCEIIITICLSRMYIYMMNQLECEKSQVKTKEMTFLTNIGVR